MIFHDNLNNRELRKQLSEGLITFGGNNVLKIYGTLDCQSGRRMNKTNRVFFRSEEEAISNGFRPCGHCLRIQYNVWKNGTV